MGMMGNLQISLCQSYFHCCPSQSPCRSGLACARGRASRLVQGCTKRICWAPLLVYVPCFRTTAGHRRRPLRTTTFSNFPQMTSFLFISSITAFTSLVWLVVVSWRGSSMMGLCCVCRCVAGPAVLVSDIVRVRVVQWLCARLCQALVPS